MADVLKLLGVGFVFLIVGFFINLMRITLTWNSCDRLQNADPCYFGFDITGHVINFLLLLACMYSVYQVATKNSMRMN